MALSTEHKLYIAIGVLAALGGALYYQNKKQKEEAASYSLEGRAAELPKLAMTEAETKKIDKIVINKPAGDAGPATEVVLEKKGEDWSLTKPVEYQANQNNVKSLLSSLERLEVTEMVAPGKESYGEFGLADDKALHAVFHQGDKVAADLYFGEGGGRGQMTRVAGRDGVFAVKGYSSYSFSRDVKGWRDMSIFKFDEKNAKTIELENENGSFLFVREAKKDDEKKDDKKKDDKKKDDKKKDDKASWVGTHSDKKGKPTKAIEDFEESKVNDLLRAYKALNADGFGDDKSVSDAGLDEPAATLTITLDDGGKRVLYVGSNAEGTSRWAKKEGSDQIFSIGSWAAGWTTAKIDKFQKTKSKDDAPKPPPKIGGPGMLGH